MIANRLPRALLLGSALAFAGCGGENLQLPSEGEPANITVMNGDGQSGRVGTTLAESLEVKVTDTKGRAVGGASVVFAFADDGGAASPATVTTDNNGIARSSLTLGSRVGPLTGTAEVPVEPGIRPVETSFTATALPSDANGITLVSGNDQSAPVNSDLPAPLVVQVSDGFGNPVSGATIAWSVTGGGAVSAPTTQTGANGQTSVTRTLGPTAGLQTTLASAEGLAGSPVTFNHMATAGTATGVNKISGDNQSALAGTELADPLVVQVLDAQQNPIQGRAVTWVIGAGGGSVTPENTTTDAQGFASTRWTLGPSPAGTPPNNSVNAVVSGVGTATFFATGTAGAPSASNSTVEASPTTISAVTGSSTITVTVRDASNNPVAGVSVTPASSGSQNTFNPGSAGTGTNGVATFAFSSALAESKTISATAGGVAITDQATVTVQRVSSTVEITSDEEDPSAVNEQITVEFTVSGSGGTPTGVVTVTMSGGPETCSESLTNGSGSCTLTPLTPGAPTLFRRVITASYAGDSRFAPDTDTENHRVNPLPNNAPTADFAAPTNCTAGQPCQFTDGSTDSDGTIATRSWVFQDGSPSPSTAQNPQVTFASAGSKTVTLTVTDNAGASDDVTKQVVVNAPPTAAFAPPTCVADAPCQFTADLSTDSDGTIMDWDWSFSDGGTATGQVVSHTFAGPGPYTATATLTVTDDKGATDSGTENVTVN